VNTYTHVWYDGLGRKIAQSAQTEQSNRNHPDDPVNEARDILLRKKEFEYDVAGRLTAVVLPAVQDPEAGDAWKNPRTEYIYDQYGNQVGIFDAKGRLTVFAYDEFGRQTVKYQPFVPADPGSIVTAYDALNAADGQPYELRLYDEFGRLDFIQDFEEQVTEYIYNDRGQLESKYYYENDGDMDGDNENYDNVAYTDVVDYS
jgi:YD repeat-containing protein